MSKLQKQVQVIREKKVKRSKVQNEGTNSSPQPTSFSLANCNVDCFLQEDEEAQERDAENDFSIFTMTCDEIRNQLKKILDLKKNKKSEEDVAEHRVQMFMLFMALKKLNRLDKHRCKRARDAVNEVKQKVDNFQLQLQNLLYEVVHLKKEVTKCLEFRSKDEEIDLVSVSEFYKEAPTDISRPGITQNDAHQLNLARLEWELEQRKRLSDKLKETEQMKEIYQKEIEKKKECLENLYPTLKSILDTTQPLHSELGMPLQATQLQHKVSEFLPRPLYVLYVQACAYKEACDSHLQIGIEGNVEEAKNLCTHSEDIDDESGDSDQEEPSAKRRRRSASGKKEENILTSHPLSVCLTINAHGEGTLCISFLYLIHLHIVTASVKIISPQVLSGVSAGDILSANSLLHCLFPGDTGKESPNRANWYQLKKLGKEEFQMDGEYPGRPYQWVQRLAGLEYLCLEDRFISTGVKYHHPRSPSIEEIISSIKSRLSSRVILYNHLLTLENCCIQLPPAVSLMFPSNVVAHLKSWSRASWENVLAHPSSTELLELELITEEDFIFKAVLERGSAQLSALVLISPNYPITASLFLLTLRWKAERNSATDGALWELEQEVNINLVNMLSSSDRKHLFVCQLQHLMVGFDIFLETEAATETLEGPREFSQGKSVISPARGRNRSRPYKYIPTPGIFTQR